MAKDLNPKNMPKSMTELIDHTLLKANADQGAFEKLCAEAKEWHFFSVCVPSDWVEFCSKKLQGSGVKVITVVGFPLGHSTTKTKVFEAEDAINLGATEIDMVMNLSLAKSGLWEIVGQDIQALQKITSQKNSLLKVILETAYLNPKEIKEACLVAKKCGAHFVKTSTGFAPSGAKADDVRLMRETVGTNMGVKASGGIRSLEDANTMIAAGATRLGTSNSVEIVQGLSGTGAY